MSSQCTFAVNRPITLVDEKIDISINNLQKNQNVTVFALLEEPPAIYMSHAHFTSNDNGEVHLSEMPSTGGTYKCRDGMGLIWSMVPTRDCRPGTRMMKKDITQPFRIHMGIVDQFQELHSKSQVDNINALCRTTVERWFLSERVERLPVKVGRIRGTLFVPKGGARYPGVIDVFGTTGGLIEFRAALLASHGYVTLALAYALYDDLPNFSNLELDYFDEAVEWLSNHDRVDATRGLGILGISKGGEMALHAAAYNPKISACVTINCPYFYEIGAHTYRGEHINVLEFDPDKIDYSEEGFILKGALEDRGDADIVPVHQIKGAVLLLQGMDDQTVGSYHADVIAGMLKKAGNHNYVVHKYPDAGHLIEPPYIPLTRACIHKMVGVSQLHGGTPAPHAQAQEHAWAATLDFFRKHLGKSPVTAKL